MDTNATNLGRLKVITPKVSKRDKFDKLHEEALRAIPPQLESRRDQLIQDAAVAKTTFSWVSDLLGPHITKFARAYEFDREKLRRVTARYVLPDLTSRPRPWLLDPSVPPPGCRIPPYDSGKVWGIVSSGTETITANPANGILQWQAELSPKPDQVLVSLPLPAVGITFPITKVGQLSISVSATVSVDVFMQSLAPGRAASGMSLRVGVGSDWVSGLDAHDAEILPYQAIEVGTVTRHKSNSTYSASLNLHVDNPNITIPIWAAMAASLSADYFGYANVTCTMRIDCVCVSVKS